MTNTQDPGYAAEKVASDAHLDQLIMSHRKVANFLPDEADQLSAFALSIVNNQVTGAQLVSTLWTALCRLAKEAPIDPAA